MARAILIKPVITEKSDALANKGSKYTFVVDKGANKVEIGKAIEKQFSVKVASVNTLIVPGKSKSRNTKNGVISGKVSSYKKAIVTLASGDKIDIFGGTSE
jgi:large subunit ribosomal protein L23